MQFSRAGGTRGLWGIFASSDFGSWGKTCSSKWPSNTAPPPPDFQTFRRLWSRCPKIVKSDARYFVVKIKCHCDFIIVFWANSYFIFQMHHAKIFKMRYIKSLYKPFWKYESWFCSEVSKTHFTKYPWNYSYAGMKKNILSNNIS